MPTKKPPAEQKPLSSTGGSRKINLRQITPSGWCLLPPLHPQEKGALLDFRLLTKDTFNQPKGEAVTQNRPRLTRLR